MKCLVCNKKADLHHVKTRGAGGTDDEWNLMPLSRLHHIEIHKIGTNAFSEKYPCVKNWLLSNGWSFNEFKKKWTHY